MALDYTTFDSARAFVVTGLSSRYSVSVAGSTKGGGYWLTTITDTTAGTAAATLSNTGSGAYSTYFVPYSGVAEPIVGQNSPFDALGYDFSFNVQRLYDDLGLSWTAGAGDARVLAPASGTGGSYVFNLGTGAHPASVGAAALTSATSTVAYLQTADGDLWAAGAFLEASVNPARSFRLQDVTDYDGVAFDAADSWVLQGHADVNNNGVAELILTNKDLGRWMTLSLTADGAVDMTAVGRNATRIVGVYEEPIIENRGTVFDSALRFEADIRNERLSLLGGGSDTDGDGITETWFVVRNEASITGDDVYLRALMHDDGNIRYANYLSLDQMRAYNSTYGAVPQGDWMAFSV